MGNLNSSRSLDLVTIYVLTYRRFHHLYSNIDSIFKQSYGNIELIVSDDGSDDFPLKEVREYIEINRKENISNVIVLANKENVGTVKHANKALRHAHGEVLIPLACDDEFYSDDVVERIMNRYKEKSFNMLVTTRYGVDGGGGFVRYWPHREACGIIEEWSRAEMYCAMAEARFLDFASGSVMTMRTDFFRSVGPFDERYKYWEDGPFLLKTLRLGYNIDTAYDIISIRYEQTEGVSNSPELTNSLLTSDTELFWQTDRQIAKNDYGYKHRRMMNFLLLRRSHQSWFYHKLLDILYVDLIGKRFRNKITKIKATPPSERPWGRFLTKRLYGKTDREETG